MPIGQSGSGASPSVLTPMTTSADRATDSKNRFG